MKTIDKKKMVLITCGVLVFTFLHPWSVVDNIVTPDGTTVSSPVWGPYPIYWDVPPDHSKEIMWAWTPVQALVLLLVAGGVLVFVSARAGPTSASTEVAAITVLPATADLRNRLRDND